MEMVSFLPFLNFLYFLCYYFTSALAVRGESFLSVRWFRVYHIMTGTLGGTVVAGKPDYVCILP